ncbi:MAG TPA: hypothetical protein VFX59_11580 [Polyangiales bacterium]|nr:hypothetical protein [Polyangiales bacterium]
MAPRGFLASLALLAVGCADDGNGLRTADDPVMVGECPCRLEVKFENLAICASPTTPSAPAHVFSSSWDLTAKHPVCGAWAEPQPVPSDPWSRSIDIKSACTGAAQFCLVLKAGDAKALSADDCELTRRCNDIDYPVANATQMLGALPGWVGTTACAARYEQLGGYLELNVASTQLGCGTGAVERIQICPSRCNDNPLGAGCDICGDGSVLTTF